MQDQQRIDHPRLREKRARPGAQSTEGGAAGEAPRHGASPISTRPLVDVSGRAPGPGRDRLPRPSPRPAWAGQRVVIGALAAVVLLSVALVVYWQAGARSGATDDTAAAALARSTSFGRPVAPALLDSPPAPAATVAATSPAAVVTGLVVCDGTIDCGVDDGSLSHQQLHTCFRLTAGGSGRPVILAATSQERAPTGPDDPSIVARSSAIGQSPAFGCHTVWALGGTLAPGTYWMWVLDGSTALARTSFIVGAVGDSGARR